MPTYSSTSIIDYLHDQTDHFISRAVSQWQMLPATHFEAKPSPTQWSANQCLSHLNSYGNYYLPEIERAIALAKQKTKTPSATFSSGWLGGYFTKILSPDAEGVPAKKMKSPKDHSPLQNTESVQVIATFIEQQEKMLLLLEQAKEVNLNTTRLPISLTRSIRLKLGDVLLFLVAHNSRHILQAERALALSDHTELSSLLFSTDRINVA